MLTGPALSSPTAEPEFSFKTLPLFFPDLFLRTLENHECHRELKRGFAPLENTAPADHEATHPEFDLAEHLLTAHRAPSDSRSLSRRRPFTASSGHGVRRRLKAPSGPAPGGARRAGACSFGARPAVTTADSSPPVERSIRTPGSAATTRPQGCGRRPRAGRGIPRRHPDASFDGR